jgi:hypothetical protein
MVGSVPRLLAELERITRRLEIPDQLRADSEQLWEAADAPDPDGELWQRFGRESPILENGSVSGLSRDPYHGNSIALDLAQPVSLIREIGALSFCHGGNSSDRGATARRRARARRAARMRSP